MLKILKRKAESIPSGNNKEIKVDQNEADNDKVDINPETHEPTINVKVVQMDPVQFCDFSIHFDDYEFRVHKVYLCNNSKYFNAFLENQNPQETSMELNKDFGEGFYRKNDFEIFLKLLYGNFEIKEVNADNVFKIIGIASYFDADRVLQLCTAGLAGLFKEYEFLERTQNAWHYLHIASKYNCDVLKSDCINHVCSLDNVEDMLGYNEYAHLISGSVWKELFHTRNKKFKFQIRHFHYCSHCESMQTPQLQSRCNKCHSSILDYK